MKTSHFTVLSSYQHFLMVSWIRSSARRDSAVNDADRLPGGWASSAERSGAAGKKWSGNWKSETPHRFSPNIFFLVGDSDMWYLFWDIVVKVPCLAQLPHPVAFCEFEFLSFSCLVLFGLGFVFRFCIVPTFCCFTDPCLALFPLFRYAERCFSCQQTVVRWVVVKTCPMESHRGWTLILSFLVS